MCVVYWMRHAMVWLALVGCGGGGRKAEDGFGWHGTAWREASWPEVSCFAYSAARRAYACIGWEASDEELWAAAETANAAEFLRRLPA